jgi:hypothetical protein
LGWGLALTFLVLAPRAFAGSFSAPVALPAVQPGFITPWDFAIDERGEAIAAVAADHGVLVYPLRTGTRLGRPWLVQVHGGYPATLGSYGVALDDRRRVALAFVYDDEQSPPGAGEHGGPGCCSRVAVASWRLGTRPPLAQTLSPRLGYRAAIAREPNVPAVVIDRSAVTALWTLGPVSEAREPAGHGELQEAFGPFGRPLNVATLTTAANGIQFSALAGTPSGTPLASWVEDRDRMRVASGASSGALRRARSSRSLPGLTELDRFDEGAPAEDGGSFTTDDRGDVVFSYLSGPTTGPRKLLLLASSDGRPFGAPRPVAALPAGASGTVIAGSDGSLVGTWQWIGRREVAYQRASLGGLASPFGAPAGVGEDPVGFIGADGEAVVVYRAVAPPGPNSLTNFQLDAVVARPGRPFGKPRQLAPRLRNCGLDTDGELDLEPIATSPDGYAVLYLTCEEGGGQYMIRYTP